jgi:hypothetical protein
MLPASPTSGTPASDGSQHAAESPTVGRFRDSAMESSRPQTSPSSGGSSHQVASCCRHSTSFRPRRLGSPGGTMISNAYPALMLLPAVEAGAECDAGF